MIKKFIQNRVLKNFFQIELNSFERDIADSAIEQKYAPSTQRAVGYALLLIPALFVLDTSIVVSVLIPTTMVAGTAWFSVSLASMKKKFEQFGMELTTNLFVAFTLSLLMLFLATAVSLTQPLWQSAFSRMVNNQFVIALSAVLALLVVGKLLFSIFSGSLKYDINDAMLTGQNEAAERYFKQSLSLLYTTSQRLQSSIHNDSVANYSLGLAFYELINNIRQLKMETTKETEAFLSLANQLIKNPSMEVEKANKISIQLSAAFFHLIHKTDEIQLHRSYQALQFELNCLEKNTEDREMVDTRMAVIFTEMANLIEEFGPSLFKI